ncbi:LysR family transcriptional regulator [Psychromonas ossibalaenae]|uniref:LysR family transcriptional regulator n=1 Tax=Psychromonas ossibalaenae TaxID=444922 RepID=UPI0003741A76|nr:LysR family transcriptional regulator [Psychromonas ossibalaenae]
MCNLEQLKMFVLCAKLGSFSACAKKLGKVQSAVSQGIANLEIDVNNQLFDRSTRKPKLTEAGQHLLTFAEAALQQVHEFECAANALNNNEESKLSIVIDDGLLLESFYNIIEQFAVRFPATSLEVFSAASSDIIDLVNNGGADIALMYSDMSFTTEVDLCYIGSIAFTAVVSPVHPLAKLSIVSAPQLTAHRQLMVKGLYNNQSQSVPLAPLIWWANDYRMQLRYIEKGIGWGYLPWHLVEKELISGQLHALKLSFDHKAWSIPVERITPKNRIMGPACLWLAEQFTTLLE